jgi:hypothetical protein
VVSLTKIEYAYKIFSIFSSEKYIEFFIYKFYLSW